MALITGGESGIRTHDTLLTYTRSPGVRLRPLGHLSDPAILADAKKPLARAVMRQLSGWDAAGLDH